MRTQTQIADRNIRLYVLIKVFIKRVFLPLAAIYFVQVDHFTLREIGLLGSFFAVVQLLAEVPTGYFADKFARVTSIRIGALLNVAATLIYVLVHTKAGVFFGTALEAIGYSFIAGAGEALVHDSLVVKKQEARYSKVVSRAQAVSLLINAAILAVVPMTYAIDPRLPFLIGTLAFTILFTVASFMSDVKHSRPPQALKRPSWTVIFSQRRLIYFGLIFGVISALYTAPSDIFNLAIKSFGLRPEMLGWVFAASSVLGAMAGLFIHLLRKLPLATYVALDSLMLLLPFAGAYTQSVMVFAITIVLSMSFWRYRKIIYQDHMLTRYPTSYKATLLSVINNIEQLNLIWLPVTIAYVVGSQGYGDGLGLIGLAAAATMPLFYVVTVNAFGRK